MTREEEKLEEIVFPLLQWFGENARELPWRSRPTPYGVWVSEIMLQQTRVAAVLGYFARFMDALPTVADLAAAEEERLMKLWQGLGYYNRARNMQRAARQIMAEFGGRFPSEYDALRSLPGVGDYTAGAIASIAFGRPVPAVDGNVLRVLARLLNDPADIARQDTRDRARARLLAVIPQSCPGQFNQALMELGAVVCLPNGAPLCGSCPLRGQCGALRAGRVEQLPVKGGKKDRRVERRQVYLLFWDGCVALRRRADRGLLAGLWEYPNELADGTDWPAAWGLKVLTRARGGAGRHVFTHLEWQLEGVQLTLTDGALPAGWVWADGRELRERYPLPSAFRCFAPLVTGRVRHF